MMPGSRDSKQAAIAVVARHFRAILQPGPGSRNAHLIIAGKRIAVEVVAAESQVSRGSRTSAPRLRFDRVALRLLERLRQAVPAGAPDGATVIATITAPIRLPSRTAATLEESIRVLLAKRSARRRLSATVHGNQAQIAILRGGRNSPPRLIGFVHNRDSDPRVLFDLTRSLLRSVDTLPRPGTPVPGERWLVVAYEGGPSWLPTYRHICAQLAGRQHPQRILLVDGDGRVSTLAE